MNSISLHTTDPWAFSGAVNAAGGYSPQAISNAAKRGTPRHEETDAGCAHCGHAYGSCQCGGLANRYRDAQTTPFGARYIDPQHRQPGGVESQSDQPPTNVIPPPRLDDPRTAHQAVGLAAELAAREGQDASTRNMAAENLGELSPEERAQVQKLQARDQEVKSHEQAHIAAAGGYAGGANYSYEVGPDGKRYAVSGSVSIDTAPVPGDPEATERKARTIRRAAMAPAEPSSADQAVAARASQMESEARMKKQQEEQGEHSDGPGFTADTGPRPEAYASGTQDLKESLDQKHSPSAAEEAAEPLRERAVQAYSLAQAYAAPAPAREGGSTLTTAV